jgi:hypothetical protein
MNVRARDHQPRAAWSLVAEIFANALDIVIKKADQVRGTQDN